MQDFKAALRLSVPVLGAYWFLGITNTGDPREHDAYHSRWHHNVYDSVADIVLMALRPFSFFQGGTIYNLQIGG